MCHRNRAEPVKELVEYLYRHYPPGGHYCRPVLVDNLVKEGPFTRQEIHRMACMAHQAGLLDWGFTYENGHHFPSQYTHQDLYSIALTQKRLKRT